MTVYLTLALLFMVPLLLVGTISMALTRRWWSYSPIDLLVAALAAPVWLTLTMYCSSQKTLSNLFFEPAVLGAAAGLVPLTAAAIGRLVPRSPRWLLATLLACFLGLAFHLCFPALPE